MKHLPYMIHLRENPINVATHDVLSHEYAVGITLFLCYQNDVQRKSFSICYTT